MHKEEMMNQPTSPPALTDHQIVAFMNHLAVGILIVDKDDRYVFCNNAATRITGVPKEEFLYSKVHNSTITEDYYLTDMAREHRKTVSGIKTVITPARKFRELGTVSPVFDEHGDVSYLVAMLYDLDETNRKLAEAVQTRAELSIPKLGAPQLPGIVAESRQMKEVLEQVYRIRNTSSPVVVQGESGVGKEVVVRLLHHYSGRSTKPLVDINCASLPEQLLEAELFGYERGAFTGALNTGKQGLIEQANGGTLFLDEINSMTLLIQGKLLRVLESKKIRHLGGLKDIPVDFRVIAASNQDLRTLCREGKFREDLFYRLNVIPLTIPPLRCRPEDIIPLTEKFLAEMERLYGISKTFSHEAKMQLLAHAWPGNVRELRNLVERIIVTSAEDISEIRHIQESMFGAEATSPPGRPLDISTILLQLGNDITDYDAQDFSLEKCMQNYEKRVLQAVLGMCRTTYEAANILKINQSSVVRKKKKHRI